MTLYETLGLIAAWLVLLGGLSAWVFAIREKAVKAEAIALANKKEIDIEIVGIKERLARGNERFDFLGRELGDLKNGVGRIEERMESLSHTMERIGRALEERRN